VTTLSPNLGAHLGAHPGALPAALSSAQPGIHPIVILGGGPAGSSAALTLRRWLPEIPVLLLDRAAPGTKGHANAGPRVGESLSPGVMPLLQHLGLGESFLRLNPLPAGGTASAWGSDAVQHRPYLFTGMGQGWQIDRARFDRWLLSEAVAAGTVLWRADVTQVERTVGPPLHGHVAGQPNGFVLRLDQALSVHAQVLIDASGRSARLARALGAKVVARDPLVARVQWYTVPGDKGAASDGALIASVPNGWWYCARLPNGHGVQMLMADASTFHDTFHDTFHNTLQRPDAPWPCQPSDCAAVSAYTASWQAAGPAQTRAAGSRRTDPVVGPGWVAAGDAAAAFDPLASLGIGFALRSGMEAARVAAAALEGDPDPGEDYAESVQRIVGDYEQRLAGFYAQENRWDTAFWRSRSGSSGPTKRGAASGP
jgi:flavin-dependent dehydrogenase